MDIGRDRPQATEGSILNLKSTPQLEKDNTRQECLSQRTSPVRVEPQIFLPSLVQTTVSLRDDKMQNSHTTHIIACKAVAKLLQMLVQADTIQWQIRNSTDLKDRTCTSYVVDL